jgi:hypothetical protein
MKLYNEKELIAVTKKKKNPSKIAKILNCNLLAAIPPFDPIIH